MAAGIYSLLPSVGQIAETASQNEMAPAEQFKMQSSFLCPVKLHVLVRFDLAKSDRPDAQNVYSTSDKEMRNVGQSRLALYDGNLFHW